MKTPNHTVSLLALGKRRLALCLGLRTSPRRKTTPPPILLRMESHISHAAIAEAAKTKPRIKDKIPSNLELAFPVIAEESPLKALQSPSGLITRAMNWIQTRQLGRSDKRRLHVAETVSLGEKRFVAVIQIDGSQYLVGGGATNVALLAKLNGRDSFEKMLKQTMTVQEPQIENPAAEEMREKA
jgi:hypothetical protein